MAKLNPVTRAIRYEMKMEKDEFIEVYGLNKTSYHETIRGARLSENVLEALKLNDLLKFLPEKAKELIKKRNLTEYMV